MDLFTLVARLGMDSSDYEKGIGKARGSFNDLGNFINAKAVAFGTMAARAIEKAADAAVNLGKSAVQAAADIEAEKAQFRATFGDMQGAAEKAFDAVSKSTGIMSTRLQKVGTKAFSQFKGAGLGAADALAEMERYTGLAADAAAYYDITLEEADEKLRSFLRGNTEAGDAIGLFTSESQRNTAAMDMYGKKWTKLTEAQKQMLMLNISEQIYKDSGAIGQAAAESDAWTNVVGNLKEAWRQTLGIVGAPIKFAILPVIEKFQEFLQDETVQLRFEQFGLTIGTLAHNTFEAIGTLIDKLLTPGTEENGVMTSIIGVFEAIGKVGGLVLDNVMELLELLIGGGDGTDDTMGNIQTFFEDVKTFIDTYEEPISTLITAIMGFWAVTNPFGAIILALGFMITNWSDIKAQIVMAKNWFDKFIKTNVPADFLQDAIDTWNTLLSIIVAAQEAAWSMFEGLSKENITKGAASVQQGYESGGIAGALTNAFQSTSWGQWLVDTFTGGGRSFATGLDYVPYNDYAANLHEGEAVLTKAEATAWRNGTGSAAIDYAALSSAIGGAVRDALEGAGVYMSGERVGDLVTERVSRNIAVRAQSRRYQPV